MNVGQLRESVLSRYSAEKDVGVYAKRSMDGLREWERRLVEKFMNPSEVLSIGCGGGRESFALEALGFVAYGLDISEQQIASANSKKSEIGSIAQFLTYDGYSIPFQETCFGSITMWSQVLGNVPGSGQRLKLLRECFRVLRADGTLSVSVHDRERTMRILRNSGAEFAEVDGGEPGDLLYATGPGVYCYWHYFTPAELRFQCMDAGLTVIMESTSDQMGQEWGNLNIIVCTKGEAEPTS